MLLDLFRLLVLFVLSIVSLPSVPSVTVTDLPVPIVVSRPPLPPPPPPPISVITDMGDVPLSAPHFFPVAVSDFKTDTVNRACELLGRVYIDDLGACVLASEVESDVFNAGAVRLYIQ